MGKALFSDYVFYQNEIYYFDGQSRIPGKLDVNTGVVKYIEEIEGYEINRDAISNCLLKNGKIFSLQNCGDAVSIYDIKRHSCKYIPLSCNHTQWGNFAYLDACDENIFIFPRYENRILRLDINSGNIQEIKILDFEAHCGTRIENKIWIFSKSGKYAIVFDPKKQIYKTYNLPLNVKNLISCTSNGYMIYIWNEEGEIFVLDTVNDKIEKISDLRKKISKVLYAGNKLILLPLVDNEILIMNLNNNTCEIYHNYPEDFTYYEDIPWSRYAGLAEDSNCYYLLRMSNYILKIEKATGKIFWTPIFAPTKQEKIHAEIAYGKKEFCERDNNSIDFIYYVKDICMKDEACTRKIGNNIWEKMNV